MSMPRNFRAAILVAHATCSGSAILAIAACGDTSEPPAHPGDASKEGDAEVAAPVVDAAGLDGNAEFASTPDGGAVAVACADAGEGTYFDLRIDGVAMATGAVKTTTNQGQIQVTAGYPALTQSPTSNVFFVRFTPTMGVDRCFNSVAGFPTRQAGYDYSEKRGAGSVATGAGSVEGAGPCSMSITETGAGGFVAGGAEGTLFNITPGLERTFQFRACWRQPYP